MSGESLFGDNSIRLRIALALALISLATREISAQTVPLFIRHVAVVDVVSGEVRLDMTVEIRGRTIAAMDSGDRLRAPRGATLVDGRGKYLIPGLWDMHVHLSFPAGAALFVSAIAWSII